MRAFTSVATALCLPLLAVVASAQDLEPRVQTSGANAAPISADTQSKDAPAAKPSSIRRRACRWAWIRVRSASIWEMHGEHSTMCDWNAGCVDGFT